MSILITGFEPNDENLNASEVLINSLIDNPIPEFIEYKDLVRFEIMPGNTNSLEKAFAKAVKKHSPSICILIGQASDRNKITFERLAINLKNFIKPDRAGNLPKEERILADEAVAYWSTLPGLELVEVLEKNNIPAALSSYGGTHLCNQILYHALHLEKVNNLKMKSGFVHIPILPEQVIKHLPNSPFMPLDMTQKALSLIVKTVINNHVKN